MIIWDEEKNKKLKKERNISFEDVAQIILEGGHKDILENPQKEDQFLFIVTLRNYTYAVLIGVLSLGSMGVGVTGLWG